MKKLIAFGGILLSGLAGLLVLTNPSQAEYEQYGAERLTEYLREKVCNKLPTGLGELLQSQGCKTLVDIGSPQLPKIIAQQTRRHNYLLFSIYETNLYLYQFQTFGILHNFYTYQIDKEREEGKGVRGPIFKPYSGFNSPA
jgi:hypothetical protein